MRPRPGCAAIVAAESHDRAVARFDAPELVLLEVAVHPVAGRVDEREHRLIGHDMAADPQALEAEVRRLAETLLANTVIEDFTVRVEA